MMQPAPTLDIRAATPADTPAAVRLLADAYVDSEVACWIVPDPAARAAYALGRLQQAADQALHRGVVHIAADRDHIIGAALWLACPTPAARHQPAVSTPAPPEDAWAGGGLRVAWHRRRHLDWLLLLRHPGRPHHHLTHLAVRADRRRRGVAGQLLLYCHAYLHTLGAPGYLEADTPDAGDLFHRHGYSSVGRRFCCPAPASSSGRCGGHPARPPSALPTAGPPRPGDDPMPTVPAATPADRPLIWSNTCATTRVCVGDLRVSDALDATSTS
jgi:GNAT superfamily N-acetyltransferase